MNQSGSSGAAMMMMMMMKLLHLPHWALNVSLTVYQMEACIFHLNELFNLVNPYSRAVRQRTDQKLHFMVVLTFNVFIHASVSSIPLFYMLLKVYFEFLHVYISHWFEFIKFVVKCVLCRFFFF